MEFYRGAVIACHLPSGVEVQDGYLKLSHDPAGIGDIRAWIALGGEVWFF